MASGLGTCIAAFAPVTGIIVSDVTSNGCAPVRWDDERRWIIYEYADAAPVTWPWAYSGGLFDGNLKAGDVNCRDLARIGVETDDRCGALLKNAHTDDDKLFLLNPGLRGDCSNIKYNTPYCTRGCKSLRRHEGFVQPTLVES